MKKEERLIIFKKNIKCFCKIESFFFNLIVCRSTMIMRLNVNYSKKSMNFIEMIFGDFIFGFLWKAIRRIGALVSWPFLNTKYSIDEIFVQFCNRIIGITFISIFVSLSLLLFFLRILICFKFNFLKAT